MMFGCEEQVQSSLCIPFSMFVFPHCVALILACFHILRRSFHVCGNPLGHMVCIVHSNSSTSRMKMGNIGASSTSISPWLCYFQIQMYEVFRKGNLNDKRNICANKTLAVKANNRIVILMSNTIQKLLLLLKIKTCCTSEFKSRSQEELICSVN